MRHPLPPPLWSAGVDHCVDHCVESESQDEFGLFSDWVDSQTASLWAGFDSTATLGIESFICGDLADLAEECGQPGWDAYGAKPLDGDSLYWGTRFLREMPWGTPLPEATVDPDGQLSFEWASGPRTLVSVSFGPDGTMDYIAMLGSTDRERGRREYVDGVPPQIVNLISEVV